MNSFEGFIPELAKGTIRIASSDYATTVILPTVLKGLSQKCPHIHILMLNVLIGSLAL
jgi:DNA-binding transcriptional LysR family regulator